MGKNNDIFLNDKVANNRNSQLIKILDYIDYTHADVRKDGILNYVFLEGGAKGPSLTDFQRKY